ncbi:MAG: hypothetical protein COV52_01945 [Gammaproteobacteria bacterium CG11_big_fil_rev_8_21_14_0_20_46_22]|nr:MAG: hypothetical protein COW05_05840 [Gammaproteobacteria bacterium CG12_big_fil_rev_8_21_14_0_65_46_12]PIR11877.1 MAG: hypothetical protein COV52_01945 [Gammaproteobacteria bacterium CG11_big_fil_rev_8_21_14_0_20_46_22]
MSATQWLHFINPFIVITIALALVASIPVSSKLSKEFGLSKKPLAWKKALFVLFVATAFAWLLARIAPHFAELPQVKVNLIATSQLGLTITLVAVGIVILRRLFQRNNCFSLLLILLKNYFPLFAKTAGFFAAAVGTVFVDSLDDKSFAKNQSKSRTLTDEEKVLRTMKTNHKGDYCDEDKLNWY